MTHLGGIFLSPPSLLDVFIDHAAELDKQFRATGKTVGPLHGLPGDYDGRLSPYPGLTVNSVTQRSGLRQVMGA